MRASDVKPEVAYPSGLRKLSEMSRSSLLEQLGAHGPMPWSHGPYVEGACLRKAVAHPQWPLPLVLVNIGPYTPEVMMPGQTGCAMTARLRDCRGLRCDAMQSLGDSCFDWLVDYSDWVGQVLLGCSTAADQLRTSPTLQFWPNAFATDDADSRGNLSNLL
jgi:hypothetical protein